MENPTPTTAVLSAPPSTRSHVVLLWLGLALLIVSVVCVSAVVAAASVREAAKYLGSRIDDSSAVVAKKLEETADVVAKNTEAVKDIEVQVPPSNDKLFTILSKGVGITEYSFRRDDVGTTPEAAFAADLSTAQQTDAWTQEFTITNLHGTQNLCWKPLAWSASGATCTLKCAGAAASITCSGASTDGYRLPAGQGVTRRFDGTSCLCVVGSGAATDYQTERVVR